MHKNTTRKYKINPKAGFDSINKKFNVTRNNFLQIKD